MSDVNQEIRATAVLRRASESTIFDEGEKITLKSASCSIVNKWDFGESVEPASEVTESRILDTYNVLEIHRNVGEREDVFNEAHALLQEYEAHLYDQENI